MTNLTDAQPATNPDVPPPGDPRAVFARAVGQAAEVIAAVRPDQLDLPTPCADLDVRGLLGHLVLVLHRVEAVGRGVPPADLPVQAPDLADDAWPAAWRDAAHVLQATWTDASLLDRPMQLPWATMPGAAVLATYVNEVTVHTWDLARATGQTPEWDDDVVGVAFAAIREAMPAEGRAEAFEAVRDQLPPGIEWQPPFGPAVEVPDDAPLVERLVAWNGRTP